MTTPLLRVIGTAMQLGGNAIVPFSTPSFLGGFEVGQLIGPIAVPQVLESAGSETSVKQIACTGNSLEMMERLVLEGKRPPQTKPDDRFETDGRLLAARDWFRMQNSDRFPNHNLVLMSPRTERTLAFRQHFDESRRWMDVTVSVGAGEETPFRFSKTTRVYSDHVQNVEIELVADPSFLAPIYCNGRAWALHELVSWIASALYYDVNLFAKGEFPYEGLQLLEPGKAPLQMERDEVRPQEFVFPSGWELSSDTFLLETFPWKDPMSRVQVFGRLSHDGMAPRIGIILQFHPTSPAGMGWSFPGNKKFLRFLFEGISGAKLFSKGAGETPAPVASVTPFPIAADFRPSPLAVPGDSPPEIVKPTRAALLEF